MKHFEMKKESYFERFDLFFFRRMIIIECFIDYRRDIFKADIGLIKNDQFPMAFVENAQRFVFSSNIYE
jgi:hypothetical protein